MIDGGKVMKVLFSPIGNTDPWSNERDGAMLHIVRHYRPEKVILFLQKVYGLGMRISQDENNLNGKKLYLKFLLKLQLRLKLRILSTNMTLTVIKTYLAIS